ncbi:glutamine amidotransferase [compost metagenome]
MERWLIGHTGELTSSKVDLGEMRAITARYAPAANEAGKRLFNTWLDGASA